MAEKKEQHFVPEFYLKKFSLYFQKKKVNIFNISSLKFMEGAGLGSQARIKYFYGRDLKIENTFGRLETESSKIINCILEKQTLPVAHSRDHQMLLVFIITLFGRTKYAAEMIDELVKKYEETVSSMNVRALSEFEQNTDITLTDAVQESLEIVVPYFPIVRDLCWKLIINETEQPFVTSDHPVVLYNQFLEPRKTYGSNVGLACKGLEIFLPLSPKFTLILFDKDVYKVGTKNKNCVKVDSPADIKALNLLQFANAHENIYFNEEFSERQAKELMTTANRYRRKTKTNWDKYSGEIENGKQKVLLHFYGSDIRCSLKLSFVSLLKKARSYILDQKVLHVRDEQLFHLHKKFLDLVDEGLYHPNDFYEFVNDCEKSLL